VLANLRPSENTLDKKPLSDRHKWYGRNKKPNRPSSDVTVLIDAIKAEGRAYRGEEQREDRGKSWREWITIFLLAITSSFLYWQIQEMIKVYNPIRVQAEASKKLSEQAIKQSENAEKTLIQSNRAWVGPRNAFLSAEPAIGKPIEATIVYQNSGREPAASFLYVVDPFSIRKSQDATGVLAARIQNYMKACQETKEQKVGGSIIYPGSSAFDSSYQINVKTSDRFVDESIIKGEKVVIIQGCFLYRTFDTLRHSYFCYFYQQGFTKIQNLNICISGHHSD